MQCLSLVQQQLLLLQGFDKINYVLFHSLYRFTGLPGEAFGDGLDFFAASDCLPDVRARGIQDRYPASFGIENGGPILIYGRAEMRMPKSHKGLFPWNEPSNVRRD